MSPWHLATSSATRYLREVIGAGMSTIVVDHAGCQCQPHDPEEEPMVDNDRRSVTLARFR
jgi:hypothetical protein